MNCESIQEQLSAYVDNELSQQDSDFVTRHLATCKDCQDALYELQNITSGVRATLESITAPVGMEERIIRAIEASHQEFQARRLSVLYFIFAFFGGGTVALLVISPFGMVMRAAIRLMVAVVRGLIKVSTSIGHMWIAAIVIFCILLAGSSLIGLFRLLRSTPSEVVL